MKSFSSFSCFYIFPQPSFKAVNFTSFSHHPHLRVLSKPTFRFSTSRFPPLSHKFCFKRRVSSLTRTCVLTCTLLGRTFLPKYKRYGMTRTPQKRNQFWRRRNLKKIPSKSVKTPMGLVLMLNLTPRVQ